MNQSVSEARRSAGQKSSTFHCKHARFLACTHMHRADMMALIFCSSLPRKMVHFRLLSTQHIWLYVIKNVRASRVKATYIDQPQH